MSKHQSEIATIFRTTSTAVYAVSESVRGGVIYRRVVRLCSAGMGHVLGDKHSCDERELTARRIY
jgi:hypothetical protein